MAGRGYVVGLEGAAGAVDREEKGMISERRARETHLAIEGRVLQELLDALDAFSHGAT